MHEYIEAFCKQINITIEKFWEVAEKFRNQNIWKKNDYGELYIKDCSWQKSPRNVLLKKWYLNKDNNLLAVLFIRLWEVLR